MNRRGFIGGVAAMTIAPRWGRAIGSQFQYGQLNLGAATSTRTGALRRLGWELDKRTAVQVALEPMIQSGAGPGLFETPLLWLAGDRAFDLPPPATLENLRRFLTFGGLLFIDGADGVIDGPFARAAQRLTTALLPQPEHTLRPIEASHVLYQSFYLLNAPHGRLATAPTATGVTLDNRLVIVHSANDTAGAFMRDPVGNYALPCEPGGETQRELAFRFGLNVTLYALCLDYKTDQVHVPELLRRRRWKPGEAKSP